VRADELPPAHRSATFGRGCDGVSFQKIRYRLVADFVAEIIQRARNPAVSPAGILSCQSQNQFFDLIPCRAALSGTLEDVHALDYLDYEGLGYPPSGISGTALVWGNVLACQLEMSWVTDSNGHLLLMHEVPGSRIAVWPYARVLEVQERSLPQFEKYAWILEGVIRDCLEYGDLSDRARDWAQRIVAKTLPLP